MADFYTELSDETAGWLADAARRFNVDRSEIVQRALDHYLGHAEGPQAATEQRQQHRASDVDRANAKQTLRKTRSPFDDCPLAGNCPGDVCPL